MEEFVLLKTVLVTVTMVRNNPKPMRIGAKSCLILGRFCFRIGSVIALAGARDLLAIGTKSGSFSKVFWPLGLVN
jgi:ABC-type transporter Mla maintaining outer membrane lipid asymmetry permease subunit MlaE